MQNHFDPNFESRAAEGVVYDGKRMRVFTTRDIIDYNNEFFYDRFNDTKFHTFYDKYPNRLVKVNVNKSKCPINTLAWTPDGRRLITGGITGEFTLWNAYYFNFETIMQAHESPVRCIEFAPSGKFMASSCSLGFVKFWDLSMSNVLVRQAHTESIRDISFSHSDNKFCTASDDGSIKVWDSRECKEECQLKGHGWDVRTAKWNKRFALIASGGKDNTIRLWDPRGKEISVLHSHKNTILAMQWNEHYLLSGGKDGGVKIMDLRTLEVMATANCVSEVTSLTVKDSENYTVGTGTGHIQHFTMFRSHPEETFKSHESTIWSMKYHPMQHILASGSADCSTRFFVRNSKFAEDAQPDVLDDVEPNEAGEANIPGLD